MKIISLKEIRACRWQGGITREIYRDKADFGLRISCAEIDPGESSFSDFSGYDRILRVIEGSVQLKRKSGENRIKQGQELYFSGSEKIQSSNAMRVVDFNIIYSPQLYNIKFSESTGRKKYRSSHAIVFALDSTVVFLEKGWTLNKYDHLRINFSPFELQGNCLLVTWENIQQT